MEFPDARLLIFAKAPEPGMVKSRLIPYLGARGAARLYAHMADYRIRNAAMAGLCPVELWCSPSRHHPFFAQYAGQYPVALFDQSGGDLGERMAHGLTSALQRAAVAVVIGTDCPAITVDDLRQCLVWLQGEAEIVIGPAEDAGYYLLGTRRVINALFSGIPWGGPQVLPITRQRIEQSGVRYRELATHWDVDRPEDVERLRKSGLFEVPEPYALRGDGVDAGD